MSTPDEYFLRRVPEAWNRRLLEQARRGADGAALLAKMRAAELSLAIRVPGWADYHLSVRDGEMRATKATEADVLLSLVMGKEDCAKLEASVGGSPLALLGSVGGDPDFVVTPARLEILRGIEGTVRVQITCDDAWGVIIHFGPLPAPDPLTTVSIPQEELDRWIGGEAGARAAVPKGRLVMEGDVEIPGKMAMATLAPE